MAEKRDSTSLLEQLKRRRVIRVAITYGAVAFVALQLADLVFPALGVDDAVYRFLVLLSLGAFPVVVLLAWLFDLTPEGLRRATADGATGPVVAQLKPLAVYGGLGLVVLAVLAAVLLTVTGERSASIEVAAGAEVIAVLPFETRGEGVEMLEEGMVDLLSRNLDEVGAIRTVAPRVVLSHWRRERPGGSAAAARALASQVGAGSALTGSAVAVGNQVRLSAELHSVDGRRLAAANVDGPADRILPLVDSLAVALLRDVWRSQRPLPGFDIQAVSTRDLEAIRAFMEGERHFRATRLDSAQVSFQRAIAADPGFALAYYRLAETLIWGYEGVPGQAERARTLTEKADSLSDRLPVRERLLVTQQMLRWQGDAEAARDTLESYLARYPDDPEAQFFKADAEFHLASLMVPPEEELAPFDRVLELDPTYLPALIHPLRVAFAERDSALIQHYLPFLERALPPQSRTRRIYRAAAGAVLGPPTARTLVDGLGPILSGEFRPAGLAWQARIAVRDPLIHGAILLPADQQRAVLDWLAQIRGPGANEALEMRLILLVASGRIAEAQRLLDDQQTASVLDAGTRELYRLLPAYLGYLDGADLIDDLEARLPPSRESLLLLLSAIDREDAAELDRLARRASTSDPADSTLIDAYTIVAQSFGRLLDGDTLDALADLNHQADSLRRSGSAGHEPLYLRWLEWSIAYSETPSNVLALLQRPWPDHVAYEAPRLLLRAKAAEKRGDNEAARRHYRTFMGTLGDADPTPFIQARLQAARTALEAASPDLTGAESARSGPP